MKYELKDSAGYCKYDNYDGRFWMVRDNDVFTTCTCRDDAALFWRNHLNYKGSFKIGFKSTKLDLKKLRKFWNLIESRLGKAYRVYFHTCNFDNVVIIKPSKAWAATEMSRGVFTLLLRLSVIHYEGDFDKAVSIYDWANRTKIALNHFLNGHTKPTFTESSDYGQGFVRTFLDLPEHTVKTMLVKP